MVVPKFLARNGPSGTYSHFWMSRAVEWTVKLLYKEFRNRCITAPIVHEHHSKDVLICIRHGNGFAKIVWLPDKEGGLQLEVEKLTLVENGWFIVVRPRLTNRTSDGGARYYDRRGTTVISDWQVLPVWHQSVFFSPVKQSGQVLFLLWTTQLNTWTFPQRSRHEWLKSRSLYNPQFWLEGALLLHFAGPGICKHIKTNLSDSLLQMLHYENTFVLVRYLVELFDSQPTTGLGFSSSPQTMLLDPSPWSCLMCSMNNIKFKLNKRLEGI